MQQLSHAFAARKQSLAAPSMGTATIYRTTLSKAHDLLTVYTNWIESLIVYPGEHSILAQRAEEAMSFQELKWRESRSPIIVQAQFIRAVADKKKQMLFQASVVAARQEMYKNLVSQIVLNTDNWQLGT